MSEETPKLNSVRDGKSLEATTILFIVIFSLEMTFSGFLLFSRIPLKVSDRLLLTQRGVDLFRPERDMLFYLIGIATAIVVTLAAMLAVRRLKAFHFLQNRDVKQLANNDIGDCQPICDSSAFRAGVKILCGAFLIAVYLFAYTPLRTLMLTNNMSSQTAGEIIFAIMVASWLIAGLAVKFEPILYRNLLPDLKRYAWQKASSYENSDAIQAEKPRVNRNKNLIFDIGIPCLLFLSIFIPRANIAAGNIYIQDRMHHWDFFMVGPSAAYAHGGALGTEIYSQYGMGYPVLAVALERFLPLTYSTLIHLSTLYACLYFTGVYFFLRLLVKKVEWAALGTAIAVSLQLFHGLDAPGTLWQCPSSTILRAPCDIWFMITLLLASRTKRRIWLFASAFLVGLALFMETDTGVYLAAAFAIYLLIRNTVKPLKLNVATIRKFSIDTLGCLLIAGSVLISGLWIASRGTMLNAGFTAGWLEVFHLYPSGISMIPVIEYQEGVVGSMLMIGVYLFTLCSQASRQLFQNGGAERVLKICISFYGLCLLIQFIGRSHPFNMYHGSIPFALLISCSAGDFFAVTTANMPARIASLSRKLIPIAAFTLLILFTCLQAEFRCYPNFINSIWSNKSDLQYVSLLPQFDDIYLPVSMKRHADDFREVTSDAKAMTMQGNSVMFLVKNEPVYQLASGSKRFLRYSPLLHSLMTKEMVVRMVDELKAHPPDFMYVSLDVRLYAAAKGDLDGTKGSIAALQQFIRSNYTHERNSGTAEVWRSVTQSARRTVRRSVGFDPQP